MQVHDGSHGTISSINFMIKVGIRPHPKSATHIGRVYGKQVQFDSIDTDDEQKYPKFTLDDYFLHQGNIDANLDMIADVLVEITDIRYREVSKIMKKEDYELICNQQGFNDLNPYGEYHLEATVTWNEIKGPDQFIYYIGGLKHKPEDNFAALILNSKKQFVIKILKMPPDENALKYQIIADDVHTGYVKMHTPKINLHEFQTLKIVEVDEDKEAIVIELDIKLVISKTPCKW